MNDNFDNPSHQGDVEQTAVGNVLNKPEPLPEGIPEKFWDPEKGAIRVEAMAKSYQELERKLGSVEVRDIPETSSDYSVTINGEPYETDTVVNEHLHAAGLTQDQVQTVYELANEKLTPLIAQMQQSMEHETQTEQLKTHFGNDQKWTEAKRQIAAWGRENLTNEVFDALSSTYEGVVTMHRMMRSNEPGLGKVNSTGPGTDEKDLRAMMSDPRYWRERDPSYIEQVRKGFRNLYPD